MENLLNETAWRRANKDTISAFHTVKFWLFELLAGAISTLVVLLWTPSWISNEWKIIYQVLIPVLVIALGLGILYSLYLARAPYKQRNEARVLVKKLGTSPSDEMDKVIILLEKETLILKHNDGSKKPCSFAQALLAIADQLSVGLLSSQFESLVIKKLDLKPPEGWYLPYEDEGITHLIAILYQNNIIELTEEERQYHVPNHNQNATRYIVAMPTGGKVTEAKYFLSSFGAAVIKKLRDQ